VLSEKSLDTHLAAKCIPSSINVVACHLHSGLEIVIVASKIDSAQFGVRCCSESSNVFFLDGASGTRTASHVMDCCN
jgi:hypothetical protein